MRMHVSGFIAVAALVIAIAGSPGCGRKQEVVRIGAILPLSGEGADLGNQYLHGMTLAIEELNAGSGGAAYELVVDDGSDVSRAGESFSRQLMNAKVAAVVTAGDAAALGAGPRAEREFVPLFANCDHPFVITMFRDVFRNSPATMQLAKRTFAFIAGSLKAKNVALLYSDDPPGKLVAQAMKNEIPASGLALAASEPFDASGADPKSSAIALLSQKPEAIFVYGRGASAARALAAVRRLGYGGPICVSRELVSPSVIATAPAAFEGCYAAVPGLELARPLPLAERYKTRFNAEPTPNVLVAYDAVMIVAKADRARRHGETSLVNALKTIGDHNGAAGAYSYAEREWLPPVYMTRIQGGVPVPIR